MVLLGFYASGSGLWIHNTSTMRDSGPQDSEEEDTGNWIK